jgi:peptidoglycan/LPS O-acetylase OafA/YrhL
VTTSVRLAPLQIDYLNLIRAGAAEIVLIGHASGYCLAGLERDGHLETFGVLIFFLLSGFLITSSVLEKLDRPDYGFGHYLIDRFCRIFCGYAPALIFVVAVDASVQALPAYPYRDSNSVLTWIGNLAMLQDYPVFQILRRLGVAEQPWFIEAFGSGRPFWTVAIEWWIYLGFGYLMFRIVRPRRFGAGEAVILSALGIVPLYNAMGGVGHCLTFVWAIGAGTALLRRRLSAIFPLGNRGRARWCWAGVTGVALTALGGHVLATGLQVYELQFAILIAGVLFGPLFLLGTTTRSLPRIFSRSLDRWAGYSYSLYLTHFTVLTWFTLRLPSETHWDPALFVALFVTANAVALGFWFLFERHYPTLARLAKATLDRRGLPRSARA